MPLNRHSPEALRATGQATERERDCLIESTRSYVLTYVLTEALTLRVSLETRIEIARSYVLHA